MSFNSLLPNVIANDNSDALIAMSERRREAETKELSTGSGGTAAPADATFVVMSPNPALTNERVLTVTAPIAMADGGANANVTISHDVSGVLAGKFTKVTVDVFGHVTFGELLGPGDYTHTLLDAAAHSDTVVQTPTRGSLIYGNATPLWDELPLGALYTHLEASATDVAWVANLNIADNAFLYFGNNQDVLMTYDETTDDRFEVTGADWLINGPIVNIGTAEGGGGEPLAVRVDQNAVTAIEVVNASAGVAVAAFLRLKNTAGVSGAAGAHELGLGVLGTGFTTAGIAYQDSGMIQTGANLSGGLTIRTLANAPVVCGANDAEVWRADANGLTIIDDVYLNFGTGLDTRIRYDEAGDNRTEISGAEWFFDTVDVTLYSATSAHPVLTIENANADGEAPVIAFYKNSASPLAGDDLGAFDFYGETSTGAKDRYAYWVAESLDVTNGATGGGMKFMVTMAGTDRFLLSLLGFNGVANQGEVIINEAAQDVDFIVYSDLLTDALIVQGSDGQITLGALGAGYVQSDVNGVLSSAALPGSFTGFANPTGTVGLVAVNGVATTAMRSDAAPPLSQAIAPTWTADHGWTSAVSAHPNLMIKNTTDDAVAPVVEFYKQRGTPTDGDDLGAIDFYGKTTPITKARFVRILAESLDITSGDQAGRLTVNVTMDATERSLLELTGYNGSVNQGEIVFNQDGQDVDFIVRSDTFANALYVQGSSGATGLRAVPAGAAGLYVPWLAGDASPTLLLGSNNAANDQTTVYAQTFSGDAGVFGESNTGTGVHGLSTNANGVFGQTNSGDVTDNGVWGNAVTAGRGVYGTSDSGVGGQFVSVTGQGFIASLTGAGTSIAEFWDNFTPVLTIQDGGQADFAEYIRHLGDADTWMRFQTNQWTLSCGGTSFIDAVTATGALTLGGTGVIVPDNYVIGLALAAAGRIEFDNQTTDEINFLDCNVGIGTTAPITSLHVANDGGAQAVLHTRSDTNGDYAGLRFRVKDVDNGSSNQLKGGIFFERTASYSRGSLHLSVDAAADDGSAELVDAKLTIDYLGNVGIGTTSPDAKLHVYQSSATAAIPVAYLSQVDISEEFIDYVAASAASVVNPISTWKTGNSIQGFVRVGINGSFYWMPYYDAPTS